MRDIEKQIVKGREIIKKHRKAEITLTEIDYFMDMFDDQAKQHGTYDALFKVIGNAFFMGCAVGSRNSK